MGTIEGWVSGQAGAVSGHLGMIFIDEWVSGQAGMISIDE